MKAKALHISMEPFTVVKKKHFSPNTNLLISGKYVLVYKLFLLFCRLFTFMCNGALVLKTIISSSILLVRP